jgi:hypothetical protein
VSQEIFADSFAAAQGICARRSLSRSPVDRALAVLDVRIQPSNVASDGRQHAREEVQRAHGSGLLARPGVTFDSFNRPLVGAGRSARAPVSDQDSSRRSSERHTQAAGRAEHRLTLATLPGTQPRPAPHPSRVLRHPPPLAGYSRWGNG